MAKENRRLTVITQNIDELHQRAGSLNVIELHGSLFKTECIKCGNVQVNKDVPICPALKEPRYEGENFEICTKIRNAFLV